MKKFISILIIICLNFSLTAFAQTVVFNPDSKIYHSVNCHHAVRCKKCIKIEKKEAQKQGGRPCKTCGG